MRDLFASAATRDLHDNLLPNGVVGHIGDGLLLVRHGLGGVDDVLEHGSLPTRGEHGGSLIGPLLWRAGSGWYGGSGGGGLSWDLLEVERQVGGNDAHVEQVLHVLKLALLEVAEDVELLRKMEKKKKQ